MHIVVLTQFPNKLEEISDSFSRELITLWKSRNLSGKIFLLVKNTDQSIMGYILLEEAEVTTIRGFWVDKGCRGTGKGTALLRAVCKYCDESKKITKLYVNITDSDMNKHIYQKEGFLLKERRLDFPDQIKAVRVVDLIQ